jgi:hypothetical protein
MTSEQFNQLMAGMKSAENAKAAEFDPMKGRTYIPRLSPEMNKALVDALKARLNKRADKKMSKRKKASDDYFAGEADKAMRRDASNKYFAGEAEQAEMDDQDQADEMDKLYEYGYKGRSAINKRRGVESEVRKRDAEARANKSNKVTLSQSQLDHLDEMNKRREKEGDKPLSQSEYFLLGDKETSTQIEEREERRKQQEVRDLDPDISSEEIEQDELNRRNPMLAMQLRLAEEQRFKDKKKRVRDKNNFSQDRSNIRRYRSDRSLAQSDRQDLGGVSFNRNQRIFEDFQRRNMLRKARAENAARNVRRYRP